MEGSPLFTSTGNGKWFAAITVVGVVPAPPEVVFNMFADPVGHGGIFGDVKSVKELGRSRKHQRGSQLVSELEIEQVARLHVLKMPLDASMTLKLDLNHTLNQVGLRMVKGNMLMREYEGMYTVLPYSSDRKYTTEGLPPGVADALGPDSCRQLSAKLAKVSSNAAAAAAATDLSCSPASTPGSSPSSSGSIEDAMQLQQQAGRCRIGGKAQQQSLVILQQRMQPSRSPPPGLGGFVRGKISRQFEVMFGDLYRACNTRAAACQNAWPEVTDLLPTLPVSELGK